MKAKEVRKNMKGEGKEEEEGKNYREREMGIVCREGKNGPGTGVGTEEKGRRGDKEESNCTCMGINLLLLVLTLLAENSKQRDKEGRG